VENLTNTKSEDSSQILPKELAMLTHEALNTALALLKPQSRSAMLLALATLTMGAGSCIETTLEMTNRICDRYLPLDRTGTAA
jgi:hypothetical protein